MTLCPTAPISQFDLFFNSSGERLAEMRRYGGGIPPRFLDGELDVPAAMEGASGLSPARYAAARSAVMA